MILDSDIIIDLLRNKKDIVERLKNKENLKTTTINTFEILRGFFSIGKKQENILEFINNLTILNFDIDSSYKAAEIFEHLKEKGELIDPLDLFIASIAIKNKETLLTRNIKHFSRIPDLKLEEI